MFKLCFMWSFLQKVPLILVLDTYKRLFMQTYLHTCLSLYFVYEDYVSSWKRYIVQERFVLSKIKSYFLTYDGIHKCAINFNVSYVYPIVLVVNWYNLFFLEHLFCGSNCVSTFCNVRKGTFQKKIRFPVETIYYQEFAYFQRLT